MRVAIVQLPARFVEDASLAAGLRSIAVILEAIQFEESIDLVVFPENFPASNIHACAREGDVASALARLCTGPDLAFMAGGYVIDESEATRNACFLVNGQKCVGTYYKRIPWQGEAIKAGEHGAAFRWKNFEVVPLICADVCDARNMEGLGRSRVDEVWPAKLVPDDSCAFKAVVVTTYGADLRDPYWTEPLSDLVQRTRVPAVVSGVSGESLATFWEGEETEIERHYGGGGSGAYFPTETGSPRVWPENLPRSASRGIYLIDLKEPDQRRRIAIPYEALRIGSIQY